MLTIIIGLPGSGKTYLLNHLPASTNRIIYDDALPYLPYNDFYTNVRDNSNMVYLADPRLCYYPTFKRMIDRLPKHVSVKLILFENNPAACIANISGLSSDITSQHVKDEVVNKRIKDVIMYSQHYDLELYLDYDHRIETVHQ